MRNGTSPSSRRIREMALVCKGAGFLDVREIDPGPVTATNSLGRKIQKEPPMPTRHICGREKETKVMNETIASSAEDFSPGGQTGEVANAMRSWKENLKDNVFIVLSVSVAIGLLVGYFISQRQEEKNREQWAEVLFRQAKNWLTERARETTGSLKQGLKHTRSAVERVAR